MSILNTKTNTPSQKQIKLRKSMINPKLVSMTRKFSNREIRAWSKEDYL